MSAGGNPANRRVFMIEFVASDDPIIDALNNITTQLTSLVEHIQQANGAVRQSSTDAEKNINKTTAAFSRSAIEVESSFQLFERGYRFLSRIMSYVVESAVELEKVIARTMMTFRAAGVDANNLAMSYLAMGRNAVDFMKASIHLERIGIRSTEGLREMTVVAFELGTVLGETAAQAAKWMSEMSRLLSLTTAQMKELADSTALLNTRFNVSKEALKSVSAVAPGVVSAYDIQTSAIQRMSGALERSGLQGEASGRVLDDMLKKISNPATAYKLDAIGISSQKMLESFRSGDTAAVVSQIAKGVREHGEGFRYYASNIFGWSDKTTAAMMSMAKNEKMLVDQQHEMMASMNASNILGNLYSTVIGNLIDQLRLFWEEVKSLATTIGVYLNPVLTIGVKFLRLILSVVRLIPGPIIGVVGAIALLGIGFVALVLGAGLVVKAFAAVASTAVGGIGALTFFERAAGKASKAVKELGSRISETRKYMKDGIVTRKEGAAGLVSYTAGIAAATLRTSYNTLERWKNNAAVKSSVLLTGILNKVQMGLAYAEEFLTIVQQHGIVVAIQAVALHLKAVAAKSAGITATLALAASEFLATLATEGLVAAFYTLPIIGQIALLITAAVVVMYALVKVFTSASKQVKLFMIAIALLVPPITLFVGVMMGLYYVMKFVYDMAWAVFGGIIDAISGALQPLVELYDAFGELYDVIAKLFGSGKKDAKGFFDYVRIGARILFTLFSPVIWILEGMVKIIQIVSYVLVGMFEGIYLAVKPIIQIFSDIYDIIADTLAPIMGLFESSGKQSETWMSILYALGKVVSFVFNGIFSFILFPLKLVAYAIKGIVAFISLWISALGELWDFFAGTSKELSWFGVVVGIITAPIWIFIAAIKGIYTYIGWVIDAFKELWAFSTGATDQLSWFSVVIGIIISPLLILIALIRLLGFIVSTTVGLMVDALMWLGGIVYDVVAYPFVLLWKVVSFVFTSIYDAVMWLGSILYSVFVVPIKAIGAVFDWLWGLIKAGAQLAADAVKALLRPFTAIKDAAGWVVDALFGSGLFHIVEGAGEAMNALSFLLIPFQLIGKVAGMVTDMISNAFGTLIKIIMMVISPLMTVFSLISSIFGFLSDSVDKVAQMAGTGFAVVSEVVGEVVNTATSAAGSIAAASITTLIEGEKASGSSSPTTAPASGSSAGGGGGGITIPVTLTMDGQTIASAVARISAEELLMHGNGPGSPMRGIPS